VAGLIGRRILMSIPLVLLVSLLSFLLEAIAPGDTARTILGNQFTPERYRELRRELGLDQPVLQQYWDWLGDAIHGDLGRSTLNGLEVSDEIWRRLPVTLSLIVGATVVSGLVGVALGLVSGVRGGRVGRVVDALSLVGAGVPSFWLGLVLVALLAVRWRIFPATGYAPIADGVFSWLRSLALPVSTLAVAGVAVIAKQTRDATSDVLQRPFVRSLRANGASEASVIFRHVLRNAAMPVVTVVGLVFVGLLTGTVLVESVFAMPGLGGLAVQAATRHDLPMLQGVAITFALFVVVVNLLIDVAYGWLNPKVRVG
jgi:peptide/nickel transport system permease protein